MIPILFDGKATDFSTNGITRLSDTISCVVTEERNGVFELEMVVATTTPYYEEIKEGMLVVTKPNHTQEPQAFEIYEITKPIMQRVTVRAHHISYRQSFIPVKPFSCTGITATLQGLVSNSMEANPFIFATNITNEASTYNQLAPASLRSRLGGTEGSVLDVFGGEYVWNNFNTQLLLHRGSDNGVQLRLAKNITELTHNTNLESAVTGALPYWSDADGTQFFYGDIQYNSNVDDYAIHRTVVLDLSEEFETAPSVAQLNQAGQEYVNKANLGLVNTNIKVSFIDLADTDEYSGSPLERVNLCDTVSVICPPLNISYKAKVIRLTFDALAERTVEAEIGDAKSTISKTITDLVGDVSNVITTGKKLVSVTQKIDREVGEISSTVASVQETVGTLQGDVGDLESGLDVANGNIGNINNQIQTITTNVNTVQQTAEANTRTIASVTENIGQNYYTKNETEAKIEESASGITEQYTSAITNGINGEVQRVTTMIRRSGEGIAIGLEGNQIEGRFDNDSLDFVDTQNNDNRLAWVDANEGLGGSALAVGDPSNIGNRWRIFTRQSGTHLTFTRHS